MASLQDVLANRMESVAKKLSTKGIVEESINLSAERFLKKGKDDKTAWLLFLSAIKLRNLYEEVVRLRKAEQERNYKERNEVK